MNILLRTLLIFLPRYTRLKQINKQQQNPDLSNNDAHNYQHLKLHMALLYQLQMYTAK